MMIFIKTGSGQTCEKLKKNADFLQDRAEPPVGAKVALQLVQKFGADRMRWWVRTHLLATALLCVFYFF